MKKVIFLGPSLSQERAREILPDAIFKPPARQADIVSSVLIDKPDVIGLIDGVFDQALSVWHKEILFALKEGVRVYGSSSMGALRAAETAVFGMVGIGEVYRMFADGELTDDDEVALVHGVGDSVFLTNSEPMVNIRKTFLKAHEYGVIDKEINSRLTGIAKSLYFPERSFNRIFDIARQEGMDENLAKAMEKFCSQNYVDIKGKDAELLLNTLKDLREDKLPKMKAFNFKHNHMFDALYQCDRKVVRNGTEISLESISNYVSIHMEDFNDLNFSSLNRQLVLMLADILKVDVAKEDIDEEVKRFRMVRNLSKEEDLLKWLEDNDLRMEEFDLLMKENAICRKLHRYMMMKNSFRTNRKFVLDELKLENRYPEWADKAAKQEKILASDHHDYYQDGYSANMKDLVVEHMKETNWNIDTHFSQWSQDAGFPDKNALKYELLRAQRERQIIKEKLNKLLGL